MGCLWDPVVLLQTFRVSVARGSASKVKMRDKVQKEVDVAQGRQIIKQSIKLVLDS